MKTLSLALLLTSSLLACGAESQAPPATAAATTSSNATTMAKSDIVETAANAGSFKTLVAAIKAADLESTLHGAGPFTVFAPTDEAFAALPAGTVDDLLKPANKDKLRSILTYHVVSGRAMAADVAKMPSAKTVQGKDLALSATGGVVRVGAATVTKADIACSNGVIHVIDKVLLP